MLESSKVWNVKSLDDWNVVVAEILKHFPERKIFALYGEMGVGKTTLVKSFCKALGVIEEAVSPTFSLVNEYKGSFREDTNRGASELLVGRPTTATPTTTVYHFDLYRLKNAEELLDIGFEEYLADGAFCFIEWPELAEPFLPSSTVNLRLELSDQENSRTIKTD